MSRSLPFRTAQESPINVWTKPFASHNALRLALKVDTERFANLLTNRNRFPDVPDRRSAARGKVMLRFRV